MHMDVFNLPVTVESPVTEDAAVFRHIKNYRAEDSPTGSAKGMGLPATLACWAL